MTPTNQPVMTMEETKDFVQLGLARIRLAGRFQGHLHPDTLERARGLESILHHLEAGKQLQQDLLAFLEPQEDRDWEPMHDGFLVAQKLASRIRALSHQPSQQEASGA